MPRKLAYQLDIACRSLCFHSNYHN